MTLYDDLQLRPDATEAEIKRAHRRHVKATHPDNGGDADAFIKGQKAFDVLIDPRRRKGYDETGVDPERDPAGREQAEVMNLVMEAVLGAMQADHSDQGDLLSAARMVLAAKLGECKQKGEQAKAGLRKIDKAAKRFKRRKDAPGEDIIAAVLDGQRRQVQQMIDQCQRAADICQKAASVFEAYDWNGPMPQQRYESASPMFDMLQRGAFFR